MTYDQAVNLFHLSMREFFNTGVAVGTFQITVRAVKIKVLGNVQQSEFPFLTACGDLSFAGDIAEPPITVAEKAILFVNRPGTTCKEENAPQDEQGYDCRARRHPFSMKKSRKRFEVDHTIAFPGMRGFGMFIGCVRLSPLRDHHDAGGSAMENTLKRMNVRHKQVLFLFLCTWPWCRPNVSIPL
jgi:hypothetical protein